MRTPAPGTNCSYTVTLATRPGLTTGLVDRGDVVEPADLRDLRALKARGPSRRCRGWRHDSASDGRFPGAVRSGRPRDLAGHPPAGERGRSGGHRLPSAPPTGRQSDRRPDGLFQLPQLLGGGPGRLLPHRPARPVGGVVAGRSRARRACSSGWARSPPSGPGAEAPEGDQDVLR